MNNSENMKPGACKQRRTLFAALLLSTVVSVSSADCMSDLNFLGFSPDGNHLAFEEYGTVGDCGIPYSKITFINVPQNQFEGNPIFKKGNEESSDEMKSLREKTMGEAKSRIEHLEIKPDLGTLVVNRSTEAMNGQWFMSKTEADSPNIQFENFEILVNEINLPGNQCADDYKVLAKGLKLVLRSRLDRKEKILQEDKQIPRSRGCPYHYRIERVYQYQDKIAVFLNMAVPGFEGPDIRYLVVTGTR